MVPEFKMCIKVHTRKILLQDNLFFSIGENWKCFISLCKHTYPEINNLFFPFSSPKYYSFLGVLVLLVITTLLQLSFLMRVVLYALTTVTYIIVHFVIINDNLDALDKASFALNIYR